MKRVPHAVLAVVSFVAMVLPAQAQWITQTIAVSNGWTAAYLFVDASSQPILPATPNIPISAGNPIDKIWMWKSSATVAQYVASPLTPSGAAGSWVAWELTNSQNTLTALIPNAAYLIHSTSPTPYSWKVQGQPVAPHYTWDLTGLNLIGFSTPPNNPPNFQNFLAPDPTFAGAVQIFRYVGGELSVQPPNPAPVTSQYYTPVLRGQAFWMTAPNINNTYFGPFQVNLPNASGLGFGSTVGQMTFHLVNVTPNPLTIYMALQPSEIPVYSGVTPIVATPPLLLEGALDPSTLTYAYTPVTTAPLSWTLPAYPQPGSDVAVTLGVNRTAMTAPNGSLYAGILQFTDSLGFSQVNIPVSATSANNTGLWVGTANVSQVSYDLKTYATNADGSLTLSITTNYVLATITNSASTVGTTTNLFITDATTSDLVTNFYSVSNEVINTYTSNAAQVSASGYVISTNSFVSIDITTNIDIETTVTGYYFTPNGLLVWETSSTTNTTVETNQSLTTQVLATNLIATVPSPGTPVPVTNITYDDYLVESLLVTNGIFSDPVTNVVFSDSYTLTSNSLATNAAYNVSITNILSTINVESNSYVTNYSATANTTSSILSTNYYPAPFLETFTNGPNLFSITVVTNSYAVTNLGFAYFTTNFQVISNDYDISQGSTNLVASATDLVSTFTYAAPFTLSFTNYTNLALAFTTNPLIATVTNLLVSSVSNYTVTSHNTSLDSVAAPYPLRLIIFNDSSGHCSLLERVFYGIQNGGSNVIVTTTQSALDPTQLGTARRITATHLPWAAVNTPWAFSGPLVQGASVTTTPIVEDYADQAANPFLHTYHPDHNNLNLASEPLPTELAQGSQSYTITRVITLTVTNNASDFLSLTSANSSLVGSYNESISLAGLGGATKNYLTAGSFSLIRISTNSSLITQ